MSILHKFTLFLAELIGTGMLLFFGCVGCLRGDSFENLHLQSALNFGLAVMIIIQIFGHVSGAHLNPAVTVSAFIFEQLPLAMVPVYVAAQLLGAFIGYGLVKVALPAAAVQPSGAAHALCMTLPHPQISVYQAVGIEFGVTAALVLVCAGVWDPRNASLRDSTPIRFGLTIAAMAITAGSLTGASMNPARSFAPALWNNDFGHQWIYWVGPLAAAVLCSYGYKYVFWQHVNNKRRQEELPLS